MKYHVKIKDRTFVVDLAENGDHHLKAELDGETRDLDYAVVEEGAKYSVLVDGESFNVSLDASGDVLNLIVGGHLYQAEVLDERELGARMLEQARGRQGLQVVKSVMPGIVRKVFVKEGDEVTAGTSLLILEAMKMENEIRSEMDGSIRKVHVTEGQTVNSSDQLVTLD